MIRSMNCMFMYLDWNCKNFNKDLIRIVEDFIIGLIEVGCCVFHMQICGVVAQFRVISSTLETFAGIHYRDTNTRTSLMCVTRWEINGRRP